MLPMRQTHESGQLTLHGAITTRLIPETGNATLAMVATILGVATANALLEEVLWRGVFITFWPRNL
jgi:membrane protease YdiL (CAAX protease family)